MRQDPGPTYAFTNAIRDGDNAAFDDMLEKFPQLAQYQRHDQWQFIHHAAEFGRADMVGKLIDAGTHPDSQGPLGTPLNCAVLANALPVIEVLAAKGACLTGVPGDYPVNNAVLNMRLNILNYLLDHGASPSELSSVTGNRPLHHVGMMLNDVPGRQDRQLAEPVMLSMMRNLLAAGADADEPNAHGMSATDMLVHERHRDMLSVMRITGAGGLTGWRDGRNVFLMPENPNGRRFIVPRMAG